jgi:hypothetical protein
MFKVAVRDVEFVPISFCAEALVDPLTRHHLFRAETRPEHLAALTLERRCRSSRAAVSEALTRVSEEYDVRSRSRPDASASSGAHSGFINSGLELRDFYHRAAPAVDSLEHRGEIASKRESSSSREPERESVARLPKNSRATAGALPY